MFPIGRVPANQENLLLLGDVSHGNIIGKKTSAHQHQVLNSSHQIVANGLLTCGLRPPLAPCQEPRGSQGEPAERTLLRNHFVIRRLAGSDWFTRVGVSVVY
jgi:hypothetical protein